MADAMPPALIRQVLDADDACRSVAGLAPGTAPTLEASVCYPYYYLDAACRIRSLLQAHSTRIACLVDAVNGLGATSDPVTRDLLEPAGDRLLAASVDAAAARRIAVATVRHRLCRRTRMIAGFDVTVGPPDLVYKRFWIVAAGDCRVMVDSVTGALQLLHRAVA